MPDPVEKLAIPARPGAIPYAVTLLCLAGSLCAAAATLNVAVNPRAEFGPGGLPPVVADRVHLRVQGYLDRAAPATDLVLGASRANLVAGLPGRANATANLAVAGSTPEDWRDLYAFARRMNGPPARVVLVVDQTVGTALFTPRVPRSADAARLGHGLGPAVLASRAAQSLAWDYLADTFHSLALRYVTGDPPPETVAANPAFARPDLLEEYRAGRFDPAQAGPAVEDQSRRAFGPDAHAAPAHLAALADLLDLLVADKVEAWVVLPPYQPVALADLEARYPAFAQRHAELLAFLRGWCGSLHLTDGTDAAEVGVAAAEFYDQSHPTAAGAAQLMAAVAAHRADPCGAA